MTAPRFANLAGGRSEKRLFSATGTLTIADFQIVSTPMLAGDLTLISRNAVAGFSHCEVQAISATVADAAAYRVLRSLGSIS